MADLSGYSTEELVKMKAGATAAQPKDLSQYSTEDLMRMRAAPQTPGMVEDVAKSIPGAIPRAAAGLVGLPQTLADLGEAGVKKVVKALGGNDHDADVIFKVLSPQGAALTGLRDAGLPNAGELVTKGYDEMSKAVTGAPVYRPQTGAGRIADTTAQVLVSGPGALKQKVVTGLAAGTSGEVARTMTQNPVLIGAAQLLGGGVASVPFIVRSVPAENINAALSGITEEQLKRAQSLMDDAAKMGSPITGAEALAQIVGKNKLQDIQRVVEAGKESAPIIEPMMNARPQANRAAFSQQADQIAPMPIEPAATPVKLTNAAQGAVQAAEKARTNAASPYYKATEQETIKAGMEPFLARIDAEIDRVGATSATGKELAKFREAVAPNGQPLEKVSHLDAIYKEWRDHLNRHPADPNAMQKASAGVVKPLVREFGDALEYFSPNIEKGRQAYQEATRTVVRPVKESPVGNLAEGTATNAESAMKEQSGILMPTAPRALDPLTIRITVDRLNKADPNAARDWTRQNLEGIFNEAAQSNVGGANQWGGAKFASQVAGNTAQRDNLQALIESTGGKQAWSGFNKMLEVMEAQGKRLPAGSNTARDIRMAENLSAAGGAAPVMVAGSPTKWGSIIYDWYQNFRYGKNTAEMARILTDPKSIEVMQALAKEAPNTAKAQALVGQIIAAEPIGSTNR